MAPPRLPGPTLRHKVDAAPDDDAQLEADAVAPDDLPAWPDDAIDQLTVLRAVIAEKPRTIEEAARQFNGAVRAEVAKHLETLEVLGVVAEVEAGKAAGAECGSGGVAGQ